MGLFDFLDSIFNEGYESVDDYLNQTGKNYDDLSDSFFEDDD